MIARLRTNDAHTTIALAHPLAPVHITAKEFG
jgi:hypothetical protein